MRVIYVAGKYLSSTPWGVRQNIEAAARRAAEVWRLGFVAMCPHTNSAHMEGVASDELFLAGTLELMRRCDGVLTVPGWEESVGARAEVEEARRLGLPVFHDIYDIGKVWRIPLHAEMAARRRGDRP